MDQYQWPETKTPFYSGRLHVDGEGRLWVRCHVEAGANATCDLLDRQGTRGDQQPQLRGLRVE